MKHIIKKYSAGVTGVMKVQPLARQIYEKWSRMINGINTSYDEKGNYEEKYKKFKERQSKFEV